MQIRLELKGPHGPSEYDCKLENGGGGPSCKPFTIGKNEGHGTYVAVLQRRGKKKGTNNANEATRSGPQYC